MPRAGLESSVTDVTAVTFKKRMWENILGFIFFCNIWTFNISITLKSRRECVSVGPGLAVGGSGRLILFSESGKWLSL